MVHIPCLRQILVATLTALAATGLAQADPAADLAQAIKEVTEQFKVADKNGDGVVTRAEMVAAFPKQVSGFDEIDTAKTGKLTLEQILKFMQEPSPERPGAKK